MVKIYRIDPENPDKKVISEAIGILRNRGLVVYPTDTVYGLGANPLDAEAVRKVYWAKRRVGKPLPILVSSIDAVKRIAYVDEAALRLMERFWPGPLTIVLRARDIIPKEVTLGTGKVGVRMPNHKVALMLAEGLNGLIIGTSANISGKPSPKTIEEVIEQLGDRVDLILDAGPARMGIPSTVVDLTGNRLRIIREGPISYNELLSVVNEGY
ncbi:MAG: threonylcarbamoyl-AMP synthase [Thermoprotei archaeon]|nr:MAG: threonylcarbamoyl-AMP synthase [Thermoprotei archaeon]